MKEQRKCRGCNGAVIGRNSYRAYYCISCLVSKERFSNRKEPRNVSRYMELAHSYVASAIIMGDLPKLDGTILCVDCSNKATQYEHRDYKKPLEVEPVCRRCNFIRGEGANRHSPDLPSISDG